MQLANRIGILHVDEMLAEMETWEFAERIAAEAIANRPADEQRGIPADDPDFAAKVFGSGRAFDGAPR